MTSKSDFLSKFTLILNLVEKLCIGKKVFNVSIVWPNYSSQYSNIIHLANYKNHYGNTNPNLSNLVKILSEWIILIGTRGKRVIALTPFLTQLDFIFIIENFLVSIRFLSFSPSIESLRQKKTCKNQFIWSIPFPNF